jgi:hypothetical protein
MNRQKQRCPDSLHFTSVSQEEHCWPWIFLSFIPALIVALDGGVILLSGDSHTGRGLLLTATRLAVLGLFISLMLFYSAHFRAQRTGPGSGKTTANDRAGTKRSGGGDGLGDGRKD